MKKAAGFIVNIRYLIFLLVGIALAFSVVSSKWVKVENDLVEYLPETSETRIGQKLMKEQFFTYGSAEVMVSNITVEDAEALRDEFEKMNSIRSVDFDPESTNYYNDVSALYQITFEYSEEDERCREAVQELREFTADYDAYIESDAENTLEETIEHEVSVIIIYIAVIVVVVLLLTTTSIGEVPVLLITFVVAMLLNNGSNFLLGRISFVSNSVTSILQLALSLDYAIILCNHYKEEHQTLPVKEAVVEALARAMPEIGASCLTTLGGFVAMLFMSFRLGADMGICLMKAVVISILTVFILMPGLLVLFGPLIDKTTHKTVVPNMQVIGRFAYKTRKIVPPVFLVLIAAAFLLQKGCPYVFGYSSIVTPKQNESQIVEQMIEDTFTRPGELAVILPTGDYETEGILIRELEKYPEVDHISGLANSEAMDGYMLTDSLAPRQFSELLDIDYNTARLLYTAYAAENDDISRIAGGISNYQIRIMDMLLFVNRQMQDGVVTLEEEDANTLAEAADAIESGRKQLLGTDFSRIIVYLRQDVRDQEAYDCIDRIRSTCQEFYPNGEVHVIGQLTNEYDFKKSFESDNIKVSLISILIVMIVLLFTFKSIGMPVLLILVIQGSIWINFAIPAITQEPLMFMANLVVSAIQMGANIDYAIVIGSRYMEVRPQMDKKDAIAETMRFAFPTVMTSGTILAVAGILIGGMTSEATIVGIGQSVGRGTIISMILVLFVLPQILLLGEGVIRKTTVSFQSLIDRDGIRKIGCFLLCTVLVLNTPMTSRAQTGIVLPETSAGTLLSEEKDSAVLQSEKDKAAPRTENENAAPRTENGNAALRTENDSIILRTEAELKDFAEHCSFDSWSKGKKVELKNDIEIVKYKDLCIPAFSGKFNGNGHEISGLDMQARTGSAGLFCHVMEGGSIHNLKVSGKLTADDEDLILGGIAGKNEGLICDCIFSGVLEAESTAGGIAGFNAPTGIIRNCRAAGSVSARTVSGGIAGENEGSIYISRNYCTLNAAAADPGLNMDVIDTGAVAELNRLIAPESYGITQDIGGICGRTGGRVLRCVNYGQIGVHHIGYNIGGIAGRNTGFVSQCKNCGEVYGRKDIGGIVGQAEPYTEISMTADRLDELEQQTEDLNGAASALEGQLDRISSGTQNGITEMLDTVREINADFRELKSDTDEKLDRSSQQLEDVQDSANRSLENLEDVTAGLRKSAAGLQSLAFSYEQAVSTLSEAVKMTAETRKELAENLQIITHEAAVISESISSISAALEELSTDPAALLEQIRREAAVIAGSAAKISTAQKRIEELLAELPAPDEGFFESLKKTGRDLRQTADGIGNAVGALNRMLESAEDFTDPDVELRSAEISQSVENLLSDFDVLHEQTENLNAIYMAEDTGETIKRIRRIGEDITDTLTGSLRDIRDADAYITDGSSEDLAVMTDGKIMRCSNLGAVNGDINVGGIAGTMAMEKDNDPEDDEMNISELYRKRYRLRDAVAECMNSGAVTAEKNHSGGICGKQDTGIITECSSFGSVSGSEGKYAGGIAGSSSAEITSCRAKCILEGQKYVGGIIGCGQDEDILQNESTVQDCISMVTLPEDAMFTGMISGSESGVFCGNLFVSGSAAGIGGASYAGKAEPVTYEALLKSSTLPEEFKTVNVYFTKNGELLEKRELAYGDSIRPEEYPKLASTDEYYGKWINPLSGPVFQDTVIQAEDCRYITAVNSDIRRSEESSRPMFIVEGHYTGHPDFTVLKDGEGIYRLKIPDDGSKVHCVRYDPDGKDLAKLEITYTDENGRSQKPEVEKCGRCVKFFVEGNEVVLHITDR